MTRAQTDTLGRLMAWWWLVWGVWVALPWTSTLESTPLWGLLVAILPTWFWGSMVACLALLKLHYIKAHQGYFKRALVDFGFFGCWAFAFTCIALSDVWSPQTVNYCFFMAIAWQLMNEAFQNAEVRRRKRCYARGN